jgi:hypothetical protein
MMREYHVRFRERFRGETPLYLLDFYTPANYTKLTITLHITAEAKYSCKCKDFQRASKTTSLGTETTRSMGSMLA